MSEILYSSLVDFYGKGDNMKELLKIVKGDKIISLRIIDWFVTNYSKKNNVNYSVYKDSNGILTCKGENNSYMKDINVYYDYKLQLKSFSKKKFDPFCRRDRITFQAKNNPSIETTIGQLNFFKWAINNSIVEYILDNYKNIEEDMNESYTIMKNQKKLTNDRKKRQELSLSASRGLNKGVRKVTLSFN